MKTKVVTVVTACLFAGGVWAHGDDKSKHEKKDAKSQSQPRAQAKKDGHAGHDKANPGAKADHAKKE